MVGMSDLGMQDLLRASLEHKIGAYQLLLHFGEALGLARLDFDTVEPLAGSMALTTFFSWILAYGSVPEKIAAIRESLDVFVQMCARWPGPERHIWDEPGADRLL